MGRMTELHRETELLDRFCAENDPQLSSVLICVAHPDDESVGLGGRLPKLGQAQFLYVTDGSPRDLFDATAAGFTSREDYALARCQELFRALELCAIGPDQVRCLAVVDQEASLELTFLAGAVATVLREMQAEVVVTHPYEGGHPDHDATAFAVHAACALIRRSGRIPPTVIEATSYHSCKGCLEACEFLPAAGTVERLLELSHQERAMKQDLFRCYRTQQRTLQWFPIGVERFRIAPRYDFTQPPHEGMLFYEHFDWGMTGIRFRHLAAEAIRNLRMEYVL